MDQLPKGKERRSALYSRKKLINTEHTYGDCGARGRCREYSVSESVVLEDQTDIYKLGLNQTASIAFRKGMYARVPGGWVYTDGSGCCFVPYSGEFQP